MDTRELINRNLENLGWKLHGTSRNVYFEQPRTERERRKLGGKRPDYVLYSKENNLEIDEIGTLGSEYLVVNPEVLNVLVN